MKINIVTHPVRPVMSWCSNQNCTASLREKKFKIEFENHGAFCQWISTLKTKFSWAKEVANQRCRIDFTRGQSSGGCNPVIIVRKLFNLTCAMSYLFTSSINILLRRVWGTWTGGKVVHKWSVRWNLVARIGGRDPCRPGMAAGTPKSGGSLVLHQKPVEVPQALQDGEKFIKWDEVSWGLITPLFCRLFTVTFGTAPKKPPAADYPIIKAYGCHTNIIFLYCYLILCTWYC